MRQLKIYFHKLLIHIPCIQQVLQQVDFELHWIIDWTRLEYWLVSCFIIFIQRFQNHIVIHNTEETCVLSGAISCRPKVNLGPIKVLKQQARSSSVSGSYQGPFKVR